MVCFWLPRKDTMANRINLKQVAQNTKGKV